MADDLRIVARWEDQGISKGLEKLRADMVLTTKVPGLEDLRKRFGDIEGAIGRLRQSTAQFGSAGGIGGMLGLGQLTGIASVAGLAASMRDLARTQTEMRHFSRETGIAAGHLRELQALGQRFQIAPEAMTGAAEGFADKMNLIRRGLGDTYGQIAQKAPQLAKELRSTTDNFEALGKVLSWLEKQGDPIDQKRWASEFGLGDITRLFTDGPKALREAWKEVQNSGIGKPNPELEKQSKALIDAMTRFDTSVELMKRTWGPSILGEMASAVDKLTGAFGKFSEAFEKFRGGHPLDALKTIDGATDMGLGSGKPAGTIQDGMRGDAAPLMLKQAELQRQIQVLDEQIARKESVPSATGEGHEVASDTRAKRDRLIDETKKLAEEIKRLREEAGKQRQDADATKQGVSFNGGGGGLGGLIQKASLAGFGGGGLGGGGGFGPDSPYGAGLQPFRRFRGDGGGAGGGGPSPTGGAPSGSSAGNLTRVIEEAAAAAGIDPRYLQGIRAGESHRNGSYDVRSNRREDSYGPFQLNRMGGLGALFERDTGLDLHDPRTIPDQAKWVAKHIAEKLKANPNYNPGSEWYGYKGLQNANPRWGDSGYVPAGQAGAGGDGPSHAGGERMGVGGNAATGRSPMGPVDARLKDILRDASRYLPEGYSAKFESGFRAGDHRFHGRGLATDIAIYDAQGRRLNNYQDASTFRAYEKFAQAAKKIQSQNYPELGKAFRWGGYFGGGRGKYGAVDTMHFDLGGERIGMGGGSWEHGLTDTQRRLFPGADSHGMGSVEAYKLPEAVKKAAEAAARRAEVLADPGDERRKAVEAMARRSEVLADPNDERRKPGSMLARARRAGVLGGGGGGPDGTPGGHIHGTITLKGFPAGTKADFAGTGMVREVKLNRGHAMQSTEA